MSTLVLLLGDQLSTSMSSLEGFDKTSDIVLLAEVREEATYVKHHKKKIAFLFSAMRHFAEELRNDDYQVKYVKYDDSDNKGSLFSEVEALINSKKKEGGQTIERVVVAHPAEYRLAEEIKTWQTKLSVEVDITEDNRFVAEPDAFKKWADGRKQFRMEYFYREMRKSTGYLMDDKQPEKGKWNFDSDNRNKLPKDHKVPEPTKFSPDDITNEVISLVKEHFDDHFGDLSDFHYATTRKQALKVLDEFIEQRLPLFGTYQDAMTQDEAWMYHSHVSFYLNCGLLMPHEVMKAAQDAYDNGDAPINSVEGFIRQILGWREYIRGFYWYFMPGLKNDNYLEAKRALPEFFWTANTQMNCLSQCVSQTKENAYAHHIQRLMVLGNFALLAGLDPDEVNEWYLIVYADAYEWVELPNVSSMVLFADGGQLASKPYAASGAYINKMSNYCSHCHYSVKEKTGPQACPFNYLYWDFLIRHQSRFEKNPRMAMIYRTMSKMDPEKLSHMKEDADVFLLKLENNEEV